MLLVLKDSPSHFPFPSMAPETKTGKKVTVQTGGAPKARPQTLLPNDDVQLVIEEHQARSRAEHFPAGFLPMAYRLTAEETKRLRTPLCKAKCTCVQLIRQM